MGKLALSSLLMAAAMMSPITTRASLGIATITLEKTTFHDVARTLGSAPIAHVGDAGGSRYQACYRADGPTPATYYLESGEMGSGTRVMQVGGVGPGAATAAEDPVIATRCRALVSGARPLTTDRGIALGLARADVERRVRGHGRDSSGVTLYEWSEDHGRGVDAYNVYSWLRVRYHNGRVAASSTGTISSR